METLLLLRDVPIHVRFFAILINHAKNFLTMKEKKKTSREIAGAKRNQPQSGVRAGFPSFDTRFGHQLYVFPHLTPVREDH